MAIGEGRSSPVSEGAQLAWRVDLDHGSWVMIKGRSCSSSQLWYRVVDPPKVTPWPSQRLRLADHIFVHAEQMKGELSW
jgi:hypothetical protein